jgi:NADPH-dependent ferric siderophore reductase
MPETNIPRSTQRVRHETRRRLLTVLRRQYITPQMLRITLGGTDLAGFTSLAADDHVKLFFPPTIGAAADESAAEPPVMRDYTPRRYDAARGELDIEFALHGAGPAADWAAQATPGQQLGIGGPRGSFVVTGDFDWYLLVADEAGLPAIARRLAELPASARAFVIAEVQDAAEEQPWQSRCAVQTTWLHRGDAAMGRPERFTAALRAFEVPAGTGYTWMACESGVARKLRDLLLTERGFDRQWLKASGYWKHGASATHDKLED